MSETQYDVIIVGGGPAGLAAAIYASRRAMKTLVISKDVGGQAAMTDEIENYPGFETVGGLELSQKFKDQAIKFGAEWMFNEVVGLDKAGEFFVIETGDQQKISTKTVILAFGLTPRNLEVPGEKELAGKGVSYCAICDGPLYKNKTVTVVGSGNSALDAAEFLSKICKQVYLLSRSDQFKGEQVLLDKVQAAANVQMIYNAVTTEIKGQSRVEALVYQTPDGQKQEIKTDGIFVEIGHIAKTSWLDGLIELTDRREIKIGRDCQTNVPGVFGAGDIADISYKQVVISAGEGAKAALQAYKYLQGNRPVLPDWTTKKKKTIN